MKKWFLILRAYAFPASIIPALLAPVVAHRLGTPIDWLCVPLALLSAVLFHAGTNLINDYFDFVNGIDVRGAASTTWALTENFISPKKAFRVAIFLLGAGMAVGIPMIIRHGAGLILFGAAGALGGYFYTAPPIAYKYRGWGEVCVFFLMGPLLVMASFLGITGVMVMRVALYSLPLGFLVAAIMYGNNLRDLEGDARRGLKTLAIRLGWERARRGYAILIAAAYMALIWLGVRERLFPWLALAFLPLPLFIKNSMDILREKRCEMQTIDMKTARAYLVFGITYLWAILLSG